MRLLVTTKPKKGQNMKMDKKESDRIGALALLVVTRKLVRCNELPIEEMCRLADGCRAEISNMLVEHLTQEQIADIAAGSVTAQVSRAISSIFELSVMVTGQFQMKAFIDSVEAFCSDRMGRPVKVIEEDKP